MWNSVVGCFMCMILIFILIFGLIQYCIPKTGMVVTILLSYWLGFLGFLICISNYCNATGDSLPIVVQQLIIFTILSVFVVYTFGLIYLVVGI